MQNAFTVVVFGTVVLTLLVGVISMLLRHDVYDEIGEGGMSMDQSPAAPPLDSAAARAEREAEIRQMLQARNERLARQGQPQVDIEQEIAKLAEPSVPLGGSDPGLADEVRQLVIARNERRARQGQPPLDVDAEVQRTLQELDPDA
ncbi:MAG TPA: hypothetical protein VLJ42_12415 [Solirubrobacteraceae bacterium]|nr:hypothetical protein [Solirubrobacteraceae bacterium]